MPCLRVHVDDDQGTDAHPGSRVKALLYMASVSHLKPSRERMELYRRD